MSRAMVAHAHRQQGVALLVVMWACTLLAILLGGYAMLARTEGLQARYLFAQTQAHYAAEAGLMRAIYALQDPQLQQRWTPDGRIYPFAFDGAKVNVSIVDEGGKVDLNAATPEVLQQLFRAAGMADNAAQSVAQNVVDWRSFAMAPPGTVPNAAYAQAGKDYGPRHGPFATIEELQMVLGMDPAVYRAVASQVTLWSGRQSPNPATAPPLALAAIPGMTSAQVQAQLAARQAGPASQGIPGLAVAQGVTHSIRAEATLADGTRAIVRATVRLQGLRAGAPPYAVLRWQEGDGE
ncbi:general secretion pathway protein GspK [Dyella solisilvae]|uniref:General secretion pathway protein GspK n=1 Tax=Dyella solisilvae TaxID=1920168 RepID=A0A370K7S1_9GAMM|nr:type II secretion system protein GspK [Dyella solisilvae]RDI98695.1 general secretion pathway protein GspK [Dyella solisilvae]